MHISEGVLSAPVLLGGAALSAAGVAIGLKKTDYDRLPQVAVLSSAFFVASLIHVPVGPTSAHLLLIGLSGLILGWAAFPAVLVALLLQAVLFQFGGLAVLGANTFVMAAPAVAAFYLFNALVRRAPEPVALAAAFAAGALPVLVAAALVWLALWLSGEGLGVTGAVFFAPHVVIAAVEGCVTVSVAALLRRARPELLQAPLVEE